MAVGLALLLGACGGRSPEQSTPPMSPNGEPLVSAGTGRPACEPALTQWFDAADANHDGHLDAAEFTADAARWFAVMDSDHDGSVTPPELSSLRLRLAPPAPPVANDDDDRERMAPVGGRGPSANARLPSIGSRGRREQPDPIMSADANLDNRVTWAEYQSEVQRTFAALDVNHDRQLTKDEVLTLCRSMAR
jgi:Ca2+-binding EF-hand superfamily protein